MRRRKGLIAILIIWIFFLGTGALLLNNINPVENTAAPVVVQAQIQAEVKEQNPINGNTESQGIVTSKSIEDFPGPIAGKPLRLPGETYSEELAMVLFHPGTDYAQAEGAVIRVKHKGKVTYAGPDPFLGYKVEVDCGDNWGVVYGGLKNLRVKEGDWLEVDEAIGQIGYYPDLYGDIEQTHLHYEIWHEDLVQAPI